jgi:hypothetical protein
MFQRYSQNPYWSHVWTDAGEPQITRAQSDMSHDFASHQCPLWVIPGQSTQSPERPVLRVEPPC